MKSIEATWRNNGGLELNIIRFTQGGIYLLKIWLKFIRRRYLKTSML